MLVLGRREGESIHIGDDITVKIVAIKGRRVKLTIDAPRAVRVVRSELLPTDPTETLFVSAEPTNTHLALSS